jgi:hypothetical protein
VRRALSSPYALRSPYALSSPYADGEEPVLR